MANMFDENGKYNKTEWKPGDRITAGKLNKIEESLEAINNNDIERHKEADERLDALEEQNEAVEERFDELEDLVADNKSEVEVLIYENNVKMDRLETKLDDGIDTVEAIAHTVDDKIAEADASMKAQVNQGKADMEAMVAEVEGELAHKATYYNNLNSLVNDIDIIKDSIVVTLGYYYENDGGGATYRVRDKKENEDIFSVILKNGLIAELITTGGVLNCKSVGLKSGDKNFDNSSILQNILKRASGKYISKIIIPFGYYTFKTPININFIEKYVIEGQGKSELVYEGDGYLLNIDKAANITFNDLVFRCTADNGAFYFTGNSDSISFNIVFNRILFYNGHIPVRFSWCAYLYMNKCLFYKSIQDEKFGECRILFDHNNNGNACEYTYLTNCNMTGSSNDKGVQGNAVVYKAGQFHYIEKCDFPLWVGTLNGEYVEHGIGVLLRPDDGYSVTNVYINNTSFMRTTYPLVTDSTFGRVKYIYFNKNYVSMSGISSIEPYSRQYKNIGTKTQYVMISEYVVARGNSPQYDYDLTGAYNVSISEYGELFMPKFIGSPQTFTQLNNITKGDLGSVIMPSTTHYGVSISEGNCVIDRSQSPQYLGVNFEDVNITNIKPYSTNSTLTLYAIKRFNIIPSSGFCSNTNNNKIQIEQGKTVVLKQISPINNWIIQSIS